TGLCPAPRMRDNPIMEAGRVRRWFGPVSAATLLTTALSGQADWDDRSPNASDRWGHALAFDLLRGRTVLFGGSRATWFADTWDWAGPNWARRAPANTPPARYAHALAYDLARGRTVLFGGAAASGILADTWEWDGANWTQSLPTLSPTARYSHALASD